MKQYLGAMLIPRLAVNRHVFNHLRQEANALWVRMQNRINPVYIIKRNKIAAGTDLSLDIGCGPFGKDGWINLDLMNFENITFRYDCRKGLPMREGSVARIRCEHFLEHLDFYEEAPRLLRNCYRSLKSAATLRIVVPDIEHFLLAYSSGGKEDWLKLGWDLDNLPQGFHTRMDIINYIFRQGQEHYYAYDFETIRWLLQQAGFAKIEKSEFGVSRDPGLRGDLAVNKSHSLYVEAVK